MLCLAALGLAPRLAAAALAAAVTWTLFAGVVSLGADDHPRLVAAVAARQPATMASTTKPHDARLVAAAPER